MILDCWNESTCRLAFVLDCNWLKPIVQWVIAQQGVLVQHICITFLKKKTHPKHLYLSRGLPGKICLTCFSLRVLSASHSLKAVPLQCNSAYSGSSWAVCKAPLCSTRVHGNTKRGWSSLSGRVPGLCWKLRSVLRRCVQPWTHFTDQFSARVTPATRVADALILLRGAFLIFLSWWTFFGHGRCLLTERSFWSIPLEKKAILDWEEDGVAF